MSAYVFSANEVHTTRMSLSVSSSVEDGLDRLA